MKGSSPKMPSEVWKKLQILGEKQATIKLTDLAQEIGLSPEDTLSFLRQIFPPGMGVETYSENNECVVDLNANSLQYMLPLSPGEWLELSQLLEGFPAKHMINNPILKGLKKKITENGPIKVVMELFRQLDLWDHQMSEKQQHLIQALDQSVASKAMVKIETHSGKKYQVHACKILHLDGKLSLIAEDSQDHCLVVIALNELVSYSILENHGVAKVSGFEVDEFIAAIRAMSERETRLILKIHDPQSVNLFPNHHFLGKPCMITNPNGDLIWAAYVEPCEDLYEWLINIGNHVEILDPARFKEEFLTYCEEKLRKIA